jgi:hypothetical protein
MDRGIIRSRTEWESLLLSLGKKRQSGLFHLSFTTNEGEEEELVVLFDKGKIAYPQDAKEVFRELPKEQMIHYQFTLESIPPSEEAVTVSQFLLDISELEVVEDVTFPGEGLGENASLKQSRDDDAEISDVGVALIEESLDSVTARQEEDLEFDDTDYEDPERSFHRMEAYFVFVFCLVVPLLVLYGWAQSFQIFAE